MKRVMCALLFILFFNVASAAPEGKPFDEATFQKLQKEDALVLIDVYAPWCSTCAKQQKIITDYKAKHPDVDLHVFIVDYDKDKKWVRKFKAPRQSTLILFKGEKQEWFSVAETRKETIFEALNKVVDAK